MCRSIKTLRCIDGQAGDEEVRAAGHAFMNEARPSSAATLRKTPGPSASPGWNAT